MASTYKEFIIDSPATTPSKPIDNSLMLLQKQHSFHFLDKMPILLLFECYE